MVNHLQTVISKLWQKSFEIIYGIRTTQFRDTHVHIEIQLVLRYFKTK